MTAAILLPGIMIPAHVAYAPLMAELAHSSPVVTKELEVYARDQSPQDYGLGLEMDGLDRFATEQGFDRFHLYGQSFGGAVALAYTARHPDRVASLRSTNRPPISAMPTGRRLPPNSCPMAPRTSACSGSCSSSSGRASSCHHHRRRAMTRRGPSGPRE